MLLLLSSALGVGLASFGTLALTIGKAPEGYEDKDGFHVIRRPWQGKRHSKRTSFVGTPAHRSA